MDFAVGSLSGNDPSTNDNRRVSAARMVEEFNFQTTLAALQLDENPDRSAMPQSDPGMNLFTLGYGQTSGQSVLASDSDTITTSSPSPMIPSPDGETSLADFNNNPGNLRFARQLGAVPGAGGFAHFDSPEAGYEALVRQVKLDAGRGYTLGQYITKYAPPSENDTNLYISQASRALSVSEDTPLANLDPAKVAAFQALKESGTRLE
jgi:hypothetical protein